MSSYVICKMQKENGKRVTTYLSVTGKWVKTTKTATVKSYEEAQKISEELFCNFRPVSFRN